MHRINAPIPPDPAAPVPPPLTIAPTVPAVADGARMLMQSLIRRLVTLYEAATLTIPSALNEALNTFVLATSILSVTASTLIGRALVIPPRVERSWNLHPLMLKRSA